MNKTKLINKLINMNEYMLAGYLTGSNKYERAVNGLIYLEKYNKLPDYNDTFLYPISSTGFHIGGKILKFSYSYPFMYNIEELKNSKLLFEEKKYINNICSRVYQGGQCIKEEHRLAGSGYTHFVPNYEMFIHNSINDYINYVLQNQTNDFQKAALKLLYSMKDLINRIIDYLDSFSSPKAVRIKEEYQKFLCEGADSSYGALVRINFIFQFDSCDNLGRIDYYLKNFKEDNETLDILKELFMNMEVQNAWNVCLSQNNEYTKLCLRATNGLSKPNLSIRISQDISEEIFMEIIKCLQNGFAPSFYNNEAYISQLEKLGVNYDDANSFCFGGCSELQIDGKSNTGSIDAGINIVQVINNTIKEVGNDIQFNQLIEVIKKNIKVEVRKIVDEINENTRKRAKTNPQMVRSLLCDGCISLGKEFNDGGAIYNFSTVNVVSLANAADSLYIIEELVYKQKLYSMIDIKNILESGKMNDVYLSNLLKLDLFGNDNDNCDKYAKLMFNTITNELAKHRLSRNKGYFLPACILFNSVADIGKKTTCSLDGRLNGDPIADSGGAMTGKDQTSPTALLNSVSKIDPYKALGTWVVNLILSSNILKSKNGCNCFKSMILGYFKKGGNQIQPTIIDKEMLIKAMCDENLARSIIVRVGGFSERFSNLSQEIKLNIIARTVY